MAKARWWLCDSCKSLNDMPATKCYKCRAARPARPTMLDDQYAQVGGPMSRVSISVDRSKISELAARDPIETQQGSGIVDAFTSLSARDDLPLESARVPATDAGGPAPRPMRDPVRRSISEAGGLDWRRTLAESPGGGAAGSGRPGTAPPQPPIQVPPAPRDRPPPLGSMPPGPPPVSPGGPPLGMVAPGPPVLPPGMPSSPGGPPPLVPGAGAPMPPGQAHAQGRPWVPGPPPMPGQPPMPRPPMPGQPPVPGQPPMPGQPPVPGQSAGSIPPSGLPGQGGTPKDERPG